MKVITAVLTIDDIPSRNTPSIVDYLQSKGIEAIMFAIGDKLTQHPDEAIYALRKGMIIGNHSYSHPSFSKLTFEESINEIVKSEELLTKVYKMAGVTRTFRPFRFPYGDKGGSNKAALQNYLKDNGFDKVKDTQIPFSWWKENHLDQDIDTFWTFDFAEYNIRPHSQFTKEDVWDRMNDLKPKSGAALFQEGSSHLILLHAHDETEELLPDYYRLFIDYLLERDVVFKKPEFISAG